MLKASVALYCLVGLLIFLGGANYILSAEYLAYHEDATHVPWEALSAEHQGTYLGLMKGGGAGSLSVGLTLILLSIFGLREHFAPMYWMLPVIALTFLGALNYSSWYMNATTSGGPPLPVGATLMVLAALAAVLSYLGRVSEPASEGPSS